MRTHPGRLAIRPLVRACQLPHHRPGEQVRFAQWDGDIAAIVKFTGRVVSHNASKRQMTVKTAMGRIFRFSCGHVAAVTS